MATASVTMQTFRKEYAISGPIHATPGRIWALLTTAADFPRWNSTVTSIAGRIVAGEKIALKARIAGSLPDFRQTFEQYFADLKREAENGV